MTFLELATTAARAGIIAAGFGRRRGRPAILVSENLHDLRGRISPALQTGNDLQGAVDVLEERPVTRTQIVQPRFSIRRGEKPILGTFTLTGKSHRAFPAITGQRLQLVAAKGALLIGGHQIDHLVLPDVPQQVLGLDKMVAGV